MQGNDIGTGYGRRIVVVLEPAIAMPPPPEEQPGGASKLWSGLKRKVGGEKQDEKYWDDLANSYIINGHMCQWINMHAYNYNEATEIWSFLPEPLFERLMPRINDICDIVDATRWVRTYDAYLHLQASPHIIQVVDADRERVETLWKMRGYSLQPGHTP